MNRISQRENPTNKQKLLEIMNKKFPKPVVDEMIGEFSGSVPVDQIEFSDEDMNHLLPIIESWNLKSRSPQMISLKAIIDNPANKDLLDRIRALKDGTITTDPNKGSGHYLRSPANVEKYRAMNSTTAPPIAVSKGSEVQWGFHRTIAAILRGDKEILAWIFE